MSKGLFIILVLFKIFAADAEAREITVLAPVDCIEWNSKRNADRDAIIGAGSMDFIRMRFWLIGLVTGMNAMLDNDPNLLASVNSALIIDWISRYCAAKPDSDVFDGATEFLTEVRKKTREK